MKSAAPRNSNDRSTFSIVQPALGAEAPLPGLDFCAPNAASPWKECISLAELACPTIIQAVSQFTHITIVMVVVGRLGVDELAAISIAWTWFNLSRSFMFGLAGAYDTLGSQAYGGGNQVMVLTWAITATAVLTVVAVPISMSMWYAGAAARTLFNQGEDVAQKTQLFCRMMIGGFPAWICTTVLVKVMQVQNKMWPPALTTFAAMLLHMPTTWACVHYLGFAGAGWAVILMRTVHLLLTAAWLATAGRPCISLIQPPLQEGACDCKGPDDEETAGLLQTSADGSGSRDASCSDLEAPPSEEEPLSDERSPSLAQTQKTEDQCTPALESRLERQCSDFPASVFNKQHATGAASLAIAPAHKQAVLQQPVEHQEVCSLRQLVLSALSPSKLLDFLQVGLPGGLFTSIRGAAGELTTAMAAILGTVEVDAHTTMLSLFGLLITLTAWGIGCASTIRIGNLLGAGHVQQARLSGLVTLSVGLIMGALVGLLLLLLRRQLGQAFTDDPAVLAMVASIAPLVALLSALDCNSATAAGVLRGMGRQAALLWSGLGAFWAVAVPLSWALAFPAHLGLHGLWIGQVSGTALGTAANLLMIARVDWRLEAERAFSRQSLKGMPPKN